MHIFNFTRWYVVLQCSLTNLHSNRADLSSHPSDLCHHGYSQTFYFCQSQHPNSISWLEFALFCLLFKLTNFLLLWLGIYFSFLQSSRTLSDVLQFNIYSFNCKRNLNIQMNEFKHTNELYILNILQLC